MQIANQPHEGIKSLAMVAAIFMLGVGVGSVVSARQAGPMAEKILVASKSVVGEQIVYPTGDAALVTAQVVILEPGAATGWHTHPMPTFGYILDGEIEVDYGPLGRKTFRKGEALMEAMGHVHQGRNVSGKPVRVLAVSIGADGMAPAMPADPP